VTREQWDEQWWQIYHALVKIGKPPQDAFKEAHRRMLRTFGPQPAEKADKAGPPFLVRVLAPLAGVDMNFLAGIWDWLNGKKTIIGTIITVIALVSGQLGVLLPLLGVDAVLIAKIIGVTTMVLGILHKAYKFIYKEEHP